jgi:hypothetical protein
MKRAILFSAALLTPAHAADIFTDGPNGTKVHTASGFVCPLKIDGFERDAVGERDPQLHADYCAYSALDGVYASVMLRPLPKNYDPKAMLAADFTIQEGAGGAMIGETIQSVGPKNAALPVYVRNYETARTETVRYRTLFASAAVGSWAVQVTVEYADPRDKDLQAVFLETTYAATVSKFTPPKP